MIPYQKISRWLSFDLDPVAVEDWVGNREVFGPVVKPTDKDLELEKAYQVESGQDVPEFLKISVPANSGKMDVEYVHAGEKMQKSKVSVGDFVVFSSPGDSELKVKAKGKREHSWQGAGKTKIVVEAT